MVIFSMVLAGGSMQPRTDRGAKIDEQLFRRIGDDDPAAFEELYRQTERTLYAYALSVVRNHEEALDVLQDTYLKIRASAHLYQPRGKPLAWMLTIARNLAYSKLRKESRIADAGMDRMENSLQYAYVTDPEDRMVLEAAMMVLPEQERQIVLLHAVGGYRHREIAESLGLPLSTVLSKYQRALKKLRDHLLKMGVSRDEE